MKRPLFRGKQLPSLKLTANSPPLKKEGHQSCKHQFAKGEGCLFLGGLKKTWICIMFDAIPEKVPKLVWCFFTNPLEKIWARQQIFETTSQIFSQPFGISLYTLYTQLYLIPYNGTRQATRGPVVFFFSSKELRAEIESPR